MKRFVPLVAAGMLLARTPASAQPIPELEAAVADISEARATAIVTDLVDFGTRYSGTPGCDASANWLFAEFRALGYDARLEPFSWGAETLYNVQARKVGLVRPDEVFVVLAHYDSTSEDRFNDAPGADDNASGVAAVLEAARVLAPLRFEASIEFLLTGGEEQGLLGSDHHASQAVMAGETFAGIINHDMIAYWPTGWGRDLDVCGDADSAWISQVYRDVAAEYVPSVPVNARADWGVCGDDQVSYAIRGMPAIIVMDCYEAHLNQNGESTPHYHRTSDTPATCDFALMTDVIRATAATAAVLAVPITRTLLAEDGAPGRAHAGLVLRPGDPVGGASTRIDPDAGTARVWFGPESPTLLAAEGEPSGAGDALVFYETDRDEDLWLARLDGDGDGRRDLLLTFGP